jgi:Domain of unknown function (DUF5597)/Glycosyl hydrolases family 35
LLTHNEQQQLCSLRAQLKLFSYYCKAVYHLTNYTAIMKKIFVLCTFLSLVFIVQAQTSIPHLQKQGTATQLIVNGKPLLMLCGELHNSSTSGLAFMRPLWQRMAATNLNTVVAATSWELIEKEKGKFDFLLVDSMIDGAREQNLHLILIWFASWKNGASTYMPAWVKTDVEKYPRVKNASGKSLEVLSTFGEASMEADATAFKALMKHIKDIDQQKQTVVMVQVENEVGVLNANRDYSDAANKAYSSIPKQLAMYLTTNKNKLTPELYNVWKANGFKTSGTWQEVFGNSTFNAADDWQALSFYTEELFMAWYYARYVNRVAEAGKEAYAIPMFVNAWLKQPGYAWPGKYPSGGPLPQVMDMWRAGAPSIDMIVPDIYTIYFKLACEQYHRLGNPLLIPETRGGAIGAARVFYAFGQHDAMCFSPFGIDGRNTVAVDEDMQKSYAAIDQIKEIILQNQGKGTMAGILADSTERMQKIKLGDYDIEASLGRGVTIAGGIIINTGPDEYLVAGKGLDILFTLTDKGDLPLVAIEAIDEGTFKDGKWIPGRRLNGDEEHTSIFDGTGLKFPAQIYSIQKIKLYRYK